jgi:hypothetical protein
MVLMTPTGRVVLQWHDREMGITRGVGSEANRVKPPHWVRFIREGNRFTPQHSGDSVNWLAVVKPHSTHNSKSHRRHKQRFFPARIFEGFHRLSPSTTNCSNSIRNSSPRLGRRIGLAARYWLNLLSAIPFVVSQKDHYFCP